MGHSHQSTSHEAGTRPVIIVGTAGAAKAVIEQLRPLGNDAPRVVGVILAHHEGEATDADLGATILGEIEDLPDACTHFGVRTVLVSIPAAYSATLRRLREILNASGIAERFIPPITDLLADTALGARGGPPAIDLAELVGRQPKQLDHSRVRAVLGGKRVLITGAGGSIGSELALRCASLGIAELILMERSENALFDIDRRIAAANPKLTRHAVLHDVVDAEATLRKFVSLRPQIVFHAAAHKHVPMMEDHPAAAVNNNFFGTKSVADASLALGAERFVMISTDKAVNPTSVMGATKRLAEVYVQSLNEPSRNARNARTRFSLVRFGNVLGSACSVLPIWAAQIAEGGPVTVTHRDMTRYFMTIPEAAALVIQAATIQDPDADVLVLDMGEPVRILDLACRFVRAHGLEPRLVGEPSSPDNGAPDRSNSVRIVFTGVRPGEKLSEELAYSAEELLPTPVPGILMRRGHRPSSEEIMRMTADMSGVRLSETPSVVHEVIKKQLATLDGLAAAGFVSAEAA